MSGKSFCDRDVIVHLHFGQNIFGEDVTYNKLFSCLPKSLLALNRPAPNCPAAGKTQLNTIPYHAVFQCHFSSGRLLWAYFCPAAAVCRL